MASPKWGEAAAEPRELQGDGNVMLERCPSPTTSQMGNQLPHKMPHKPPPHPRVSSQQIPQCRLDFVGDPKQLTTLQGSPHPPLPISVLPGRFLLQLPRRNSSRNTESS